MGEEGGGGQAQKKPPSHKDKKGLLMERKVAKGPHIVKKAPLGNKTQQKAQIVNHFLDFPGSGERLLSHLRAPKDKVYVPSNVSVPTRKNSQYLCPPPPLLSLYQFTFTFKKI